MPLILNYGPLTASADQRGTGIDHSFATVMDITPTILDLAGVKHPGTQWKGREIKPMRGVSWVPYLTRPSDVTSIHKDDFVQGWELFGRMAIRKQHWKATFIPEPFGPNKWELFDLAADPGETNDLADTQPEKLKELLVEWEKYVEEVGLVGQAPEHGVFVADQIAATYHSH